MSWPMIHGGAAHPLFSVRLSLRMIAPIQGCLVDRHLIGSPIATFPLGRESRALRFETFHCLSGLDAYRCDSTSILAVRAVEENGGLTEIDGRVDLAVLVAPRCAEARALQAGVGADPAHGAASPLVSAAVMAARRTAECPRPAVPTAASSFVSCQLGSVPSRPQSPASFSAASRADRRRGASTAAASESRANRAPLAPLR